MPLIKNSNLPTFDKLEQEGRLVLTKDRASHQDIREMHIGLLNMMPDAALQATERQFFRLVGESNQIAQFHMHPFTLPEIKRSDETQAYIDRHYDCFEDLKTEGLDALIITGANVEDPALENNAFWEPLQAVMDWSWNHVTSTMTACLATHAFMQFRYNEKRQPLPQKRFGIYKSRVRERSHPIVQGMNTVFDVPHSRHNDISWEQFERAGMRILVNSHAGGVHLATSPDGLRVICMQGHQEYDTVSLLKEYRRDYEALLKGERDSAPYLPYHYFSTEALELLQKYHADAKDRGSQTPFPEEKIGVLVENTWRDSGRSIIANWVGKVYQTTHVDRAKQFMDGVDPDNPLGLSL